MSANLSGSKPPFLTCKLAGLEPSTCLLLLPLGSCLPVTIRNASVSMEVAEAMVTDTERDQKSK
jgi:hypothetical protein